MTPRQIGLIGSSWDKVLPIQETAAELFYGKLFEIDPELKPLFKGDMVEQGKKLFTMLDAHYLSGQVKDIDETIDIINSSIKRSLASARQSAASRQTDEPEKPEEPEESTDVS